MFRAAGIGIGVNMKKHAQMVDDTTSTRQYSELVVLQVA